MPSTTTRRYRNLPAGRRWRRVASAARSRAEEVAATSGADAATVAAAGAAAYDAVVELAATGCPKSWMEGMPSADDQVVRFARTAHARAKAAGARVTAAAPSGA